MAPRAIVPRRPLHWLPLALGLAWLSANPAFLAARRTGRPGSVVGRKALPTQYVGGLRTLLKQREECEKNGVVPPEECLAGLVSAYAVDGDMEGADRALEALTTAGHSPSTEMLEALLDASSKRGDLAAARRHFGALNASGHPLSLDRHYLPLLAVLAKHGEAVEAKALVEGGMAPLKPDATAWAWAMLAYHRQEWKEKRTKGISKKALRVEYLFRKMLQSNVSSNDFALGVLKRAAGSKRYAVVSRELGLREGPVSEGFRKKKKKSQKDLLDPVSFWMLPEEALKPASHDTKRKKRWRRTMGPTYTAYEHMQAYRSPDDIDLGVKEELRDDCGFEEDRFVPPKK